MASTEDSHFTSRELEIMGKAWLCFDGEPKVDYSKLAELCGMTNPGSATNAWAKIKKKLAAKAGTAGEAGASPNKKATPKATPKRKKKADADADADDAEKESPSKKAKTPKAKAKKSEAKVTDDGEAEAEKETTVKEEGGDELS